MPPEEERVNSALENLFRDTPAPAAAEEKEIPAKEEVIPEKEVEKEEPEVDDETTDEDEDEEEEVDYDAPTKDKTEDEEVIPESKAVEQAKIKGKLAKELQARLTERDLEFERVSKEREELATKLAEVEAIKINPREHPEFVKLHGEAMEYITRTADTVPGDSDAYVNNFGKLIGDYMDLPARGAGRTEKMAEFKASVVDTLKLSEVPYEELEADEKKAFDNDVKKVIEALQGNVERTKELTKLNTTLEEKAKNGHLSIGVKAYEAAAKEFSEAFGVVGDLPEEAIEASPFAVASIIAKMVKEHPEAANRLKAAQKDVLEFTAGPRVYTQAELDKLHANGINIKEHQAERLRLHKDKQKKLGVMAVEGLMIRADYMRVKKELAELRGAKEGEESEFDALSKTTKKKAPKKEVEVYVAPSDRALAIDKYLGD